MSNGLGSTYALSSDGAIEGTGNGACPFLTPKRVAIASETPRLERERTSTLPAAKGTMDEPVRRGSPVCKLYRVQSFGKDRCFQPDVRGFVYFCREGRLMYPEVSGAWCGEWRARLLGYLSLFRITPDDQVTIIRA
ncbi:hypothetical protein MTO96_013830 [Rhipicephalus appendiculatus]